MGFAKEVKKKLPEIAVSLGITAITAFFASQTVKNFFSNLFVGDEENISIDEVSNYMNNATEEPVPA
ncbi:hypothetical protein MHK_005208 [Candidatus Magnetomorum sp. HK-1]|nr:hypothetical protein MHK_005208 [Candidatus Magnetomorum sp. HK-1]